MKHTVLVVLLLLLVIFSGCTFNSNESLSESLSESLNESLSENLNESSNESLSESSNESLSESSNESLSESSNESLNESLSESLNESSNESLSESSNESLNESLSESLSESSNESLNESLSESLNESLSESLNDSETKSIVKGELVFKDIDINSKKRTYALYIPTNYSSSSEFPIVFYFHGGGGDALNADKSTRFSQKAEEENFIVVYPQGTNRMFENRLLTWNTQFCCGYAMRNDVDDITFISELCKMLNEEYSINTSQVFATGFSNGGILAHHVGIELSHIFTSIAPVGSQIGGQATRNSQFYFPTRVPSHNISVLIINGELDSRVPFYGGVPQDGDDTNVYEWSSSSESLSYWLEVNNCDSNLAKTKYLNSNVRVESYCEEITEVDVRLINVKNGTHSWHGEEYEPLGGTQVSTSFNTTDYIWNFFMNNN